MNDFLRKRKYNCPNCAAPITNVERCEYCGTLFDWIPTVKCEIVSTTARVIPLSSVLRVPSSNKHESEVPEEVYTEFEHQFGKAVMPYVDVKSEKTLDMSSRYSTYRGDLYLVDRRR